VSDSDPYLRTRMPNGVDLSPRVSVLLQKDKKDRLKVAARKDG